MQDLAREGVHKFGALVGSPYEKDHSIWGSLLGPPIHGNLNVCIGTQGPMFFVCNVHAIASSAACTEAAYQGAQTVMMLSKISKDSKVVEGRAGHACWSV